MLQAESRSMQKRMSEPKLARISVVDKEQQRRLNKILSDAANEQLEKDRRKSLYGLGKKTARSAPVLSVMATSSYAMRFRNFQFTDESRLPSKTVECNSRQIELIQDHVDRIMSSDDGEDHTLDAELFLDSLRLPVEVRKRVRIEDSDKLVQKKLQKLLGRYKVDFGKDLQRNRTKKLASLAR